MKKKLLPLYIVIVCTFLAGCDLAGEVWDDIVEWLLTPMTVDKLELSEEVAAPVRGETSITLPIVTTQYTGTVKWQTEDGEAFTGVFKPSTVYKAVVTLSDGLGFTFDGLEANSFTHAGAESVSNEANSGIVTITFAPTAAEGEETQVTMRDLTPYVTAPEKGKAPVTTDIDNTQYTGTIAWQTVDGTAHTGSFAAGTTYQAVVTLTAKTDFTFVGLGANAFTHTGASSVKTDADSGTVTITFSATNEGSTNLEGNRQAVLTEARSHLGTKYVSPGSKPPTTFDCSSFVNYVFKQVGSSNPPPLGSSQYTNYGTKVQWKDVQPGDIVVFNTGSGSSTIQHVAILYEKSNNTNPAGSLIIHAASEKLGSSFVEGDANARTGILISKLGVWGDNLNTPDKEYFYQRIYFYVRAEGF